MRALQTETEIRSIGPQFIRLKGALNPRIRLFCLPFAGGSAAVFHGWGDLLRPDIEVLAAQPRGRGMRYKEPLLSSVSQMAAEYLETIRSHDDLPFALYGHSLGALLAFEMTEILGKEQDRSSLHFPRHLFIGASPPPVIGLLHPPIHHLDDGQFLDAIQERYSGIPNAVLQEPDMLEMFLPGLKADYAAHERYNRGEKGRVDCSVTAFAGLDDPEYKPELLAQWALQTTLDFKLHIVPGDHFFLATNRDQVVDVIRETLLSSLHGMSGPKPMDGEKEEDANFHG